jgi:uncharacterized protein
MLRVRTQLKMSGIHGVGCFTLEDIKQGQIVWEMDPGLDLELDEEQLLKLAPAVQEFFNIYSYGQIKNGKHTFILCGDHARHMNHSENPNLQETGNDNAQNIALRDIQAGEELTCNYHDFDFDVFKKLRA